MKRVRPTNILIVTGSPRKNANSDALGEEIRKAAEEAGAQAKRIALRDYVITGCVGCEQCRRDKACTRLMDGMQLIYPEVERAAGLVLVCPAHNYNVTVPMKAFIDRLYCYYDFTDTRPRNYSSRLAGAGRLGAAMAVCEQTDPRDMGMTLDAMTMPIEPHGYEVTASIPVLGHFGPGAVRDDSKAMDAARRLGADMAKRLTAREK